MYVPKGQWDKVRCYREHVEEHVEEHVKNFENMLGT